MSVITRLHTERAISDQKELLCVNISMSNVYITNWLINLGMCLYSGKNATAPPGKIQPYAYGLGLVNNNHNMTRDVGESTSEIKIN